ncbi:hypothetical protein JCM11491_002594 [Sporobolomyces phaffii]
MTSFGPSPLFVALAFRIANAFISRAFFQPDEYWQSLEVAHLWVFGYGWKTWEWHTAVPDLADWSSLLEQGGNGGIRSPLSVLPTAVIYELLRRAQLDGRGPWLVLAPRLLQACLAASTDVAVRGLAERLLGREYANAALLVSLTSFYNCFTSTRTFSNSTETALTAWALLSWPWEWYRRDEVVAKDALDENKPEIVERQESLATALVFAALASIIRPSNTIIWLILGARLLLKSSTRRRLSIVGAASLVSITAVVLCLVLDTKFYQTPTFTPLRFLSTNVFHSISLFYGQNPWHFYVSQGIPLLLLTQLPFFLDGLRRVYRPDPDQKISNPSSFRELGWAALGTAASYSLLSHKEWRFLHPILPILHLFVAISLVSLCRSSPFPPRPSNALLHPFQRLAVRSRTKLAHLFLVAISLVPAVYFTAFHTRGQNDVVLYLRDEMRSPHPKVKSVGFAMPCHSTPWQSHLHSPALEEEGRLWFITCEPPIAGQPRQSYLDQSDHFYESPLNYFVARFPSTVDPTFPPSKISQSRDPFSRSLSDDGRGDSLGASSSSRAEGERLALVENRFDLGWAYAAWPSHLVVFGALLDTPCSDGSSGGSGMA